MHRMESCTHRDQLIKGPWIALIREDSGLDMQRRRVAPFTFVSTRYTVIGGFVQQVANVLR